MQIRIAICDEEKEICEQLEKLFREEFQKTGNEAIIFNYQSGEELGQALEENSFDLLLVDICLPGMSGAEVGCAIRKDIRNEKIQIVYVSANEEYEMALFDTRPLTFLTKPVEKSKVERTVRKFFIATQNYNKRICLQEKEKQKDVLLSDILYFETKYWKNTAVTCDGKIGFHHSLKKIYSEVEKNRFLFIHPDYIVNFTYVNAFYYDRVEMADGTVLPIKKAWRNEVKEGYQRIREELMP